jgi:hypothetical protein
MFRKLEISEKIYNKLSGAIISELINFGGKKWNLLIKIKELHPSIMR